MPTASAIRRTLAAQRVARVSLRPRCQGYRQHIERGLGRALDGGRQPRQERVPPWVCITSTIRPRAPEPGDLHQPTGSAGGRSRLFPTRRRPAAAPIAPVPRSPCNRPRGTRRWPPASPRVRNDGDRHPEPLFGAVDEHLVHRHPPGRASQRVQLSALTIHSGCRPECRAPPPRAAGPLQQRADARQRPPAAAAAAPRQMSAGATPPPRPAARPAARSTWPAISRHQRCREAEMNQPCWRHRLPGCRSRGGDQRQPGRVERTMNRICASV